MKKGVKKSKFKAVKARAHTPPYKIHRYFARRPWNLFESLVDHHTSENQIILDPFSGGGVTPYEGVKLNRKVVACDINPLSNFIVKNMFYSGLPKGAQEAYEDIVQHINSFEENGVLQCPHCSENTNIDWFELAHTVKCNLCDDKIVLTEDNKVRNGIYKCQNADECWGSKTGITVARIKRENPVYLSAHGKCGHCGNKFNVEVDSQLLDFINTNTVRLRKYVSKEKINTEIDPIPLGWDRQKEDLLNEKGIVNFQDLFTERNLLLNQILLHKINSYVKDKELHKFMRFVFSDSLRNTNIMTFTNGSWQNGTPTSWAKHAYWLPAQFCEVSVRDSFEKSFQKMLKACEFNKELGLKMKTARYFSDLKGSANLYLYAGTLNEMNLPEKSIDAVITDPPYGSNVQYLELSHFWHPWNKDLYEKKSIDFAKEAVVNRKKDLKNAKTYKTYEDSLSEVFLETHRVLKDGGKIVMTFNNKDLKAWLALLISVFRSGYHFEKGGITFQDGVSNYRQTAHTKAVGSPYGDFVYEFIKDQHSALNNITEIDREKLVKHIKKQIDSAVRKYQKGEKDRNQILVELFNKIVPEIESFVRISEQKGVIDDLYSVFTQNHLDALYTA